MVAKCDHYYVECRHRQVNNMNIYTQIAENKRKTWLLLIGFMVFITVLSYIISVVWVQEPFLTLPIFVISLVINLFAYFFSDKTALALSGAKEISEKGEPEYVHLVENLCIATGLPMPKLHVIESDALNAFATGRDPKHASIAVTRGLLKRLDKRELEGVLAHELSHIKNYDIRVMTLIVVLVGMVAMMTELAFRVSLHGDSDRKKSGGVLIVIGLVLMIFAPLIANVIKFAVSRQREFLADASAAYITRYPKGLADALRKISADSQQLPRVNAATAHLFIGDPFKAEKRGARIASLFSTHPPVEERIRRLEGEGMGIQK